MGASQCPAAYQQQQTTVIMVWYRGLLLANSVPKNSLCLMLQGSMLRGSIRETKKLQKRISLASAEMTATAAKNCYLHSHIITYLDDNNLLLVTHLKMKGYKSIALSLYFDLPK
jgi:hypothetical protein